ncbi:MAG TPA: VOC family protein, partial [Nitrospiraceae bacterium]
MNTGRLFVSLWLSVAIVFWAAATPLFADNRGVVLAVESIGMTVSDMDRSVAFYSDVLTFKPVSDVEVDGPEYDQL